MALLAKGGAGPGENDIVTVGAEVYAVQALKNKSLESQRASVGRGRALDLRRQPAAGRPRGDN